MPRGSNLVRTSYSSLPVDIPHDFLAPLPDPSKIEVEQIDFASSTLPAYRDLYAVVLDNVLSREECDQLIHLTEMSAGAHRGDDGPEPENDGWKPAMVNAGRNHEVLEVNYRNSDRIIWDQGVITTRIWERVLQAKGMREYLSVLDGKKYSPVLGVGAWDGMRWVATREGLNERMRFLKYGAGQFFREHCDGAYETPDGRKRSFFTIHLYLNDSAQALSLRSERDPTDTTPQIHDSASKADACLVGGATTFHSRDLRQRLDVDPKVGRILIFQHRRLLHSGDTVTAGVKYTMRSDLMYELVEKDRVEDDSDGSIIFADD